MEIQISIQVMKLNNNFIIIIQPMDIPPMHFPVQLRSMSIQMPHPHHLKHHLNMIHKYHHYQQRSILLRPITYLRIIIIIIIIGPMNEHLSLQQLISHHPQLNLYLKHHRRYLLLIMLIHRKRRIIIY